MARPRSELQTILESLSENVYFQPPSSERMNYPCIVYSLDAGHNLRADNLLYRYTKRYQVTVIDRNPDSETPDAVVALPMCELERTFRSDNLNHYVFNLFF
jgi:hypothetical protein